MKIFKYLAVFAFGISGAVMVSAQETQTKVVDEVVAQVNDGVITLSRIKREMKDIVDTEVRQGKKREDAESAITEKQGQLIANLINEELMIQKAKDLGLEKDIEGSVNQRMLEMMKQNNIKTMEALNAEMEKSGLNPDDFRSNLRKQITRESVVQQEIFSKTYWGLNGKDLKDYYDKHRDKFTRPETISVSELFLAFAGRNEATVRQKAKELYDQLKAGGDFDKIVRENGDPVVFTQGGKAEKVKVADLPPVVTKAVTGVRAGDYSLPFDADQLGVAILKVDGRETASNESVFDENAVRMAMTNERFPTEQKKFYSKLRADAYIKISDSYRPLVSPILFADECSDKSN